MEENSRSSGMPDMPLFKGVEIHACCKPRVTSWEVPAPLYTKCTQSWQGDKILYNKAWFWTCRPIFKAMGTLLIWPGKGAWLTPFSLQSTLSELLTIQPKGGCLRWRPLGEESRALHPCTTIAVQATATSDQNTSAASQDSRPKDPQPFSG